MINMLNDNWDGIPVDISVDLETFASTPDASVASIGAAIEVDGELETFYRTVNDPDGRFDPRTIRWHATQEDPRASTGADEKAVGLQLALKDFALWLRKLGADVDGWARIWTHATFDIPVLDCAYGRAAVYRPWHYRNCRDLRTLYDLAGGRPELPQVGTSHRAVDDAIYQLREVQWCLERLRVLGIDV